MSFMRIPLGRILSFVEGSKERLDFEALILEAGASSY